MAAEFRSQPSMLLGRREVITAPTVENPAAATVFSSQKSKMWTPGWEMFRTRSQRLDAVNTIDSAHIVPASHAAVRRLIPPTPRSSLAPSVTTLLYQATVSQALRQTLRAVVLKDIRPYRPPRVDCGSSERNVEVWHVASTGQRISPQKASPQPKKSRDHQQKDGPRKEKEEAAADALYFSWSNRGVLKGR